MRCTWCGAEMKEGFGFNVIKQHVSFPDEDMFIVVDIDETDTMHRVCAAEFLKGDW